MRENRMVDVENDDEVAVMMVVVVGWGHSKGMWRTVLDLVKSEGIRGVTG